MKKRNLVLFGTTAMLSLALAGTIGAVTASAANIDKNTSETQGTTTVQYTVEEKWQVTIPDTITIDLESGKSAGTDQVTIAADAILGAGKKTLTVTVTGDFKLQAGEEEIEYELRISDDSSSFTEGALTTGGTIVSAGGGAEEASKYLEARIKDGQKAKTAGAYSDQLTFTVAQS